MVFDEEAAAPRGMRRSNTAERRSACWNDLDPWRRSPPRQRARSEPPALPPDIDDRSTASLIAGRRARVVLIPATLFIGGIRIVAVLEILEVLRVALVVLRFVLPVAVVPLRGVLLVAVG